MSHDARWAIIIFEVVFAQLLGTTTLKAADLPAGCYHQNEKTAVDLNELGELALRNELAVPRTIIAPYTTRMRSPDTTTMRGLDTTGPVIGSIAPDTYSPFQVPDEAWIGNLTVSAADLRLEFYFDWLTPTQPLTGKPARIGFHIRNFGQQPARDFTTLLFMDGASVGSWTFHHIDPKEDPDHQYQPLWPNEATETFAFDTPPLSGKHTFQWAIDAANEILEQNEDNNTVYCTVNTVGQGQLADLVIDIVEPTGPIEIGQKATLKMNVTNQGQTPINRPFWVHVTWDGSYILTEEIKELAVNGTVSIEYPLSSIRITKDNDIEATADVFNNINELNENNNKSVASVLFDAVDLQITAEATPSLLHAARPVLLVKITNKGTFDATRPFLVTISELTEAQPPARTIQVSNGNLPRAGETVTITIPINGWELPEDRFYIATKDNRQFMIHLDPEHVYRRPYPNTDWTQIAFSLYELYQPWLKVHVPAAGSSPDAYFLRLPYEGAIRSRTYALGVQISKAPGNGGAGGSVGSSDFNLLDQLIEAFESFGDAIEGIFNDEKDDEVVEQVNAMEDYEITGTDDFQLIEMIQIVFDGPTTDDDEGAANKIFAALGPERFDNVVAHLGGIEGVDDDIDGGEWGTFLTFVSDKIVDLPSGRKLVAINGLFEISTDDAEEDAIIVLVGSMSPQERWDMLHTPGFSSEDFDDQVDGSEWDELEPLLDAARFRVQYDVDPIKQPSENLCWVTVATMLVNWKSQTSFTMESVAQRAGTSYYWSYLSNSPLYPDEAPLFYALLGLQSESSQNPAVAEWLRLLLAWGPLAVVVREHPHHGIIVTGLEGDGSLRGTWITYIEPADGGVYRMRFADFLPLYEQGRTYPFQIIHNPR